MSLKNTKRIEQLVEKIDEVEANISENTDCLSKEFLKVKMKTPTRLYLTLLTLKSVNLKYATRIALPNTADYRSVCKRQGENIILQGP